MDKLTLPSGQGPSVFSGKWFWALAATVAAGIGLVLVIGLPRLVAVYELYWSSNNIQRLFYEDLGLSQSWSSFIAVVGSFFYGLAWIPLSLWTYRVLVWKFNAGQFWLAFGCWVFVYGHVPLLHALLGTDTCFNQRTGEPIKWYVQDADGRIVLFDSNGFDAATGAEKRLVTAQICTAFERQKTSERPRRITVDVRKVDFFDPATGRPRVWYSKASNGSFELFDSRGYHPVTSEALLPVTKEIVAEIMKRLADEEAAHKQAEEERKRAEAEEQRRAEQARRRAEVESQRQADAERKRLEAEAQRNGTFPVTPAAPPIRPLTPPKQSASADRFRFPKTGLNAFNINLLSGWVTHEDQYNGMQVLSPDRRTLLYLSLVQDESYKDKPMMALALAIGKPSNITEFPKQEPTSISGKPGQAFYGQMKNANGTILDVKMVIIPLAPALWATETILSAKNLDAASMNTLKQAVSGVTLTTGP